MKINRLFLLFLVCTALFSCTYTANEREFSNFRKSFSTPEIAFRTDGYYYSETDNLLSRYRYRDGVKHISPVIFYEDGTARVFGSFPALKGDEDSTYATYIAKNTFEEAHQYFQEWLKKPKDISDDSREWGWGAYKITPDSRLIIQSYARDEGSFPIPLGEWTTYEYRGKIIDDTTFIIMEKDAGSTHTMNEIYKFRQYSPKPDSTNWTHDLLQNN